MVLEFSILAQLSHLNSSDCGFYTFVTVLSSTTIYSLLHGVICKHTELKNHYSLLYAYHPRTKMIR